LDYNRLAFGDKNDSSNRNLGLAV